MKKTLLALFTALVLVIGLASCGESAKFDLNFVVDGEVYATVSTVGNEAIELPENPTKEGYTFDGWYWDEGVWQKPFTASSLINAPLSADMSVYAKWKDNTPPCQHRDADDNSLCDACGAEFEDEKDLPDPHVHSYTVANTDGKYLATEADCKAAATYYYSCTCGEAGTETFSHGATKEHSYTEKDTDSKYLATEADCENAATYYFSCVCGETGTKIFSHGSTKEHSYTEKDTNSKYFATAADCENAATYYFSCVCGKAGTETFSYGTENGHSYTEKNTDSKYLATAADCENAATYYFSCHCGKAGAETFSHGEANGHSYIEKNVDSKYLATAADCENAATYYFSCICGKAGTETFSHGEANGHSYIEKNVDSKYLATVADCENAATYYYSCSCGKAGTTIFSHGSANGHSYILENPDAKYLVAPAACGNVATYYRSCACGKAGSTTFTYGTPGGHNYTVMNIAPKYLASVADCENAATYYYSCSCGKAGTTIFSHGSANGHSYTEKNTAPKYFASAADCENATMYYYSCHCGDASAETFAYGVANGHSYTEKNTDSKYLATAADCENAATYYFSCHCGKAGTEAFSHGVANGHSYTEKNTDSKYLATAADCENAATYYFSCHCGKVGTETFSHGEANGHSYTVKNTDSKYLATAADCENAATYYFSCHCGKAGTETFSHGVANGHSYTEKNTDSKYLATAADCENAATYYFSCHCGKAGTEAFSHGVANGHSYTEKNTDSKYLATAADCENAATYYFSCHCGKAGTEAFSHGVANGHSYTEKNTDSKYLATAADCENAATYYFSCHCGKAGTETFSHGEANGHSYTVKNTDSKYLATAADCENAATYYFSCHCGKMGSETFSYGEVSPFHKNQNGECNICGLPESSKGLKFMLNPDGKSYTVTGLGTCKDSSIVIGSYNGLSVTCIGENAFSGSSNIRRVTLNNCVSSILDNAFRNCENLERVAILNCAIQIKVSAFNGCTKFNNVNIPHTDEDKNGKCDNCKEIIPTLLDTFKKAINDVEIITADLDSIDNVMRVYEKISALNNDNDINNDIKIPDEDLAKYILIVAAHDNIVRAAADTAEAVDAIAAIGKVIFNDSKDEIAIAKAALDAFKAEYFANARYNAYYAEDAATALVSNYDVYTAAVARDEQLDTANICRVLVAAAALNYDNARPLWADKEEFDADKAEYEAWLETYEIDETEDAQSIANIYGTEIEYLNKASAYADAMTLVYTNTVFVADEVVGVKALNAKIGALLAENASLILWAKLEDAAAIDKLVEEILIPALEDVDDYVAYKDTNGITMIGAARYNSFDTMYATMQQLDLANAMLDGLYDSHVALINNVSFNDFDAIQSLKKAVAQIYIDYVVTVGDANYTAFAAEKDVNKLILDLEAEYNGITAKVREIYDNVNKYLDPNADMPLAFGNQLDGFAAEVVKIMSLGVTNVNLPLLGEGDAEDVNLSTLFENLETVIAKYVAKAEAAEIGACDVTLNIRLNGLLSATILDNYAEISGAYDELVEWINTYLAADVADADGDIVAALAAVADVKVFGENDKYIFVSVDSYSACLANYNAVVELYNTAKAAWDILAGELGGLTNDNFDIHTMPKYEAALVNWKNYIDVYYGASINDGVGEFGEVAVYELFMAKYNACKTLVGEADGKKQAIEDAINALEGKITVDNYADQLRLIADINALIAEYVDNTHCDNAINEKDWCVNCLDRDLYVSLLVKEATAKLYEYAEATKALTDYAKDADIDNTVYMWVVIIAEGKDTTTINASLSTAKSAVAKKAPCCVPDAAADAHLDENGDCACDLCGNVVAHVDENPKDCKCDKCDEDLGHTDEDPKDCVCDECNKDLGHVDVDPEDCECDKCGAVLDHVDQNPADCVCDNCGSPVHEDLGSGDQMMGSFVPGAPDGVCDWCGATIA